MNDDGFRVKVVLAEQGNAESQCQLALMYHKGDGVAQDYKKAAEWMIKAAEQGHAEAQFQLALMYHKGDGVAKNEKKAAEWMTKAEEQGHAEAHRELAKWLWKEEKAALLKAVEGKKRELDNARTAEEQAKERERAKEAAARAAEEEHGGSTPIAKEEVGLSASEINLLRRQLAPQVFGKLVTADVMLLLGQLGETETFTIEHFVRVLRECFQQHTTVTAEIELNFTIQALEIFKQIDINGSGMISRDDFTSFVLKKAQLGSAGDGDFQNMEYRSITGKNEPPINAGHGVQMHEMHQVQKMMVLGPPLNRVALFQEHSDSVFLGRLPSLHRDGPRFVTQIRHHTAFQAHCVLGMHFIEPLKMFVTSSRDATGVYSLSFWDLGYLTEGGGMQARSPQMVHRLPTAKEGGLEVLCYSNRMEQLFSAGPQSDPLHTWNVSTYSKVYSKALFTSGNITCMQELGTTNYLLIGASDGSLCIWDMVHRNATCYVNAHEFGVNRISQCEKHGVLISVGTYSYQDPLTLDVVIWSLARLEDAANDDSDTSSGRKVVPQQRLQGHTSRVVNAEIVATDEKKSAASGGKGNIIPDHLVSADIGLCFRVWDVTVPGAYVCMQVFYGSAPRLRTLQELIVLPDHLQSKQTLLAAGLGVQQLQMEQLRSTEPVVCACFNSVFNTFITASAKLVTVWDAVTGARQQSYSPQLTLGKGAAVGEMTVGMLDERQRKLFIGNSSGLVALVGQQDGKVEKMLDPHPNTATPDASGGEPQKGGHPKVVSMMYCDADRLSISASTNAIIHICDETGHEGYHLPAAGAGHQPISKIIRSICIHASEKKRRTFDASFDAEDEMSGLTSQPELTSCGFSYHLNLLATVTALEGDSSGERQVFVNMWDFETARLSGALVVPPIPIRASKPGVFISQSVQQVAEEKPAAEINVVAFIEPLPVLAGGTTDGDVYVWQVHNTLYYKCALRLCHEREAVHGTRNVLEADEEEGIEEALERTYASEPNLVVKVVGSYGTYDLRAMVTAKSLHEEYLAKRAAEERAAAVKKEEEEAEKKANKGKPKPDAAKDTEKEKPTDDSGNASGDEEVEKPKKKQRRKKIGDLEKHLSSQKGMLMCTGSDTGVIVVWFVGDEQLEKSNIGPTRTARKRHYHGHRSCTTRMPWSTLKTSQDNAAKREKDNAEPGEVVKVAPRTMWQAHGDAITAVQLIQEPQSILTASVDGFSKIWSLQGECLGMLDIFEPVPLPGSWKFPINMVRREEQNAVEARALLQVLSRQEEEEKEKVRKEKEWEKNGGQPMTEREKKARAVEQHRLQKKKQRGKGRHVQQVEIEEEFERATDEETVMEPIEKLLKDLQVAEKSHNKMMKQRAPPVHRPGFRDADLVSLDGTQTKPDWRKTLQVERAAGGRVLSTGTQLRGVGRSQQNSAYLWPPASGATWAEGVTPEATKEYGSIDFRHTPGPNSSFGLSSSMPQLEPLDLDSSIMSELSYGSSIGPSASTGALGYLGSLSPPAPLRATTAGDYGRRSRKSRPHTTAGRAGRAGRAGTARSGSSSVDRSHRSVTLRNTGSLTASSGSGVWAGGSKSKGGTSNRGSKAAFSRSVVSYRTQSHYASILREGGVGAAKS
jgi:WD40 repeat protein